MVTIPVAAPEIPMKTPEYWTKSDTEALTSELKPKNARRFIQNVILLLHCGHDVSKNTERESANAAWT